jgi:protein-arginine kinase activator protein McsA
MTTRSCNNCHQRKNNATGTVVNNPNGLTYKWFCQDCTTKRNENERIKKILDVIDQPPISKKHRN